VKSSVRIVVVGVFMLGFIACASQAPRGAATAPNSDSECTWGEQIRFELWGEVVGGPLELEPAKAACEAMGSRCAGVTSEWYLDFPFMLISAEKPVQPGGDYGIHYKMTCAPASTP
jgi:hypothetical protein